MINASFAEYIWLDGNTPVQTLRCKTRVLPRMESTQGVIDLAPFPEWGFDGSSTKQATGDSSDCVLKPVSAFRDPTRGPGHYLVLCEVFEDSGTPHASNTRAPLRELSEIKAVKDANPWIGFEQEYTFYEGARPLGWPEDHKHFPGQQGPYYCGVGADEVAGREVVEEHMLACVEAGISIYGINAEVMLGQWEFQIGYRPDFGDKADPINMSDHLVMARYLLYRIAEKYGISATIDVKPEKGDWNGAGCHTNFSVADFRGDKGLKAIDAAVERLAAKHKEHIAVYGPGLAQRLTGLHETCSIDEFRSGVSDRGASIRIPQQVNATGKGYFEDRRPGANCDPYQVSLALVKTVLDL